MNWAALIKHMVAGFVNGMLGITGVDAIFKNVSIEGWQVLAGAGMLGALRALQEYLSPTSYVRTPNGPTQEKLAG